MSYKNSDVTMYFWLLVRFVLKNGYIDSNCITEIDSMILRFYKLFIFSYRYKRISFDIYQYCLLAAFLISIPDLNCFQSLPSIT